jgi:endonuclease G
MKYLTMLLLWIPVTSFSQRVDTVLNRGIYKSYFSYQLGEPLYVSYILYRGGGNCERKKFRFKNDTPLKMMSNLEYTGSGYDRGHLANAEDFASNCTEDELTFRYYNCLPQTPNLNRGTWKFWETVIRKDSQTDSLLIITGGIWEGKYKGELAVPSQCWKIVKSLRSGKLLYVILFENTDHSSYRLVSLHELETLIGRKLPKSF